MTAENRDSLQQTAINPTTEWLLYSNGVADRQRNITEEAGWQEICNLIGWKDLGMTPARQHYRDGYLAVPRP